MSAANEAHDASAANDTSGATPPGDQARLAPDVLRALVEETTRKASVVWLRYGDLDRARAAWHVWDGDAAYVVASASDDPFEQLLPGLADARTATVTCRSKDSRARLVTWRADTARIAPGDPEWDAATTALRAQRLNASHAEPRAERWAADAVVVQLRPTGEVVEEPGRMPSDEAAAPPPSSPATTTGKLPWVIHRRPRRRPRLS